MDPLVQSPPRTLERAFQLAKSGRFATVTQVKRQLKKEGFSTMEIEAQLGGASLFGQLKRMCLEAVADAKGRSLEPSSDG